MTELSGFNYNTATLVLEFKKIQIDDKTLNSNFYSNSKAQTVINDTDIANIGSIYSIVISNIQKSLGQDLGWIIDSVIDRNINISKHNPLVGSSYIKLPRKSLINIQNIDDNECFKLCLV